MTLGRITARQKVKSEEGDEDMAIVVILHAWISCREYGMLMAENGRRLGVYTSAIGKAIRKKEGEG